MTKAKRCDRINTDINPQEPRIVFNIYNKEISIMKRKLLALTLVLSALITGVSAHVDGGNLGDVPNSAEKITVDGKKDAIYDQALKVKVDQANGSTSVNATGEAWLLYADGHLYVYAEVTDKDIVDPDPDTQSSSPWMTDSFEVFVNEKNSDDAADIMQYRIDCSGFPSAYDRNGLAEYGPGNADSYFTYAARSTDNGYAVEYSIPVSAKEVGVNFQINDVLSDGSQSLAMAPSKVTGAGAGSWNPGEYPYITIGGSTVSLPVEDSGEATGGSAATFDFTAVAAVGAALSAAGYALTKKRK